MFSNLHSDCSPCLQIKLLYSAFEVAPCVITKSTRNHTGETPGGDEVRLRVPSGLRSAWWAQGLDDFVNKQRFRALFGVPMSVCSITWPFFARCRPPGSERINLLWADGANNIHDGAYARGVSVCGGKTLRKWTWTMIDFLAYLCTLRFRYIKSFYLNGLLVFDLTFSDRLH